MEKNKFSALIICFITFLTWGTLAIYWYQLKNINPVEIVAHRAIWSVLFSGMLVIILGQGLQVFRAFKNRKIIIPLIFSSLLIASNWGIYIWAVSQNRIVETSMGYYINPLFNIIAAAIFFKVKLNKFQYLSIIFALLGVLYMVFNYGSIPYVALFLAISFCIYGVIRKITPIDAIAGLFVETLVIAIPSIFYLSYKIFIGSSAFTTTNGFIIFLLIIGGIVTTLPLAGFSYAAKHLNLNTVGIMQYISPTTSFLIGIFLYKEVFTISHLISFIFIWIGLIIYTIDGIIRYEIDKRKNHS